LYNGERGYRRRVGTQDARTECDPRCPRPIEEHSALRFVKSALGADQDRKVPVFVRVVQVGAQGRNRIATRGILVAKYQLALRAKCRDGSCEIERGYDFWDEEDTALLCGFDGVCPQAVEVDSFVLGVPHDHRMQP